MTFQQHSTQGPSGDAAHTNTSFNLRKMNGLINYVLLNSRVHVIQSIYRHGQPEDTQADIQR